MCCLMSDNDRKKSEIDACKQTGFDFFDFALCQLFLERIYCIHREAPIFQDHLTFRKWFRRSNTTTPTPPPPAPPPNPPPTHTHTHTKDLRINDTKNQSIASLTLLYQLLNVYSAQL
jgi:hypothetical protein